MAAPVMAPDRLDRPYYPELREELAKLELIDNDGEPMESDWHRDEMNFLIESVRWHHKGRTDYFVGGNMFIYFDVERTRKRNFRGPDFFYVSGRPIQPQRRWWAVWNEADRFPNVIVELLSPTTENEDRTTKFTIYEQTFRTPDYFLYDPDTGKLDGFHLVGGKYQALTPNEHGRLWCEELQLWIGPWFGEFHSYKTTWLRFFHPDGRVALIGAEAERQRAEDERQRAEDEKKRADAAEAELARFKAILAQQSKPNGHS
jgi:Uma2 family endonuclease